MRYDAFISYRHGELDGLVAEKLHKMLETYRIPRSIAKKVGKKKLSRVFRDREELPTSANLSDSINDALENSAFLLLICSRRTCASQWVLREVERFGELRGKDKIITLLIDGEPDESFPPGLREREIGGEKIFVEPLAADIRAETWAGSLKLLKEEKLRLLAPILGCAFDDLRRRHRRRKIQQIAALVSAAFTFVLSFGSFSTYQYIQIHREMQLKLQNQSYVLAEYAERELSDGDPETALLLALDALPKDLDHPERPLVFAAERALADALGVYDVTDGFKPYQAVNLSAAPGKILLSPAESYIAALYPFELAVYETVSAQAAVKLPTVRSALSDMDFLSDTIVIFTGENGLTAYDIEKGTTLWRGRPATRIAVSGDKSVIAAVYKDESQAALYTPEGQALGEIALGGKTMRLPVDDSFINPWDTLFELNEGGDKLAVSFAEGSLSV
ncbi:MAG: toll/interleukin-1 receptor domain-containing protein, partial [Gracilibacteraceae bacterium]|nr:toll/interleukin-1 receptor domain-containing protein [Gracilibacteraceae bacterium]